MGKRDPMRNSNLVLLRATPPELPKTKRSKLLEFAARLLKLNGTSPTATSPKSKLSAMKSIPGRFTPEQLKILAASITNPETPTLLMMK